MNSSISDFDHMDRQCIRYVLVLTMITVASLSIFVGFNWLVDPYDMSGSPKINGFNEKKPEFASHLRLGKAYAVVKIQPRAICLGNSSAEVGIDPDHEGWSARPVYNLGLAGCGIYEMFRYMQHANHIQHLDQVVACLDFLDFSTSDKARSDFREEYLSVEAGGLPTGDYQLNNYLAELWSVDEFQSGVLTILGQRAPSWHLENGRYLVTDELVDSKGGYHAYFLISARNYKAVYMPSQYEFDNVTSSDDPFEHYRLMLRLAYENNIDLRLALSPCHVRQWEEIGAAGLWGKWESWKRNLVTINEDEARRANCRPYPLWDFSTYNEITTEPLPPIDDKQSVMRYYYDAAHYKKELGDMMLNQIFGCLGSSTAGETIGVLINSNNIEGHLADVRADRQHYRATHADDVAEIERIFR